MQDKLLEGWEWVPRRSEDAYSTIENGWVVVDRSGLSPQVEYSTQRVAGENGYYLGTGRSGGLEPSVTLTYGDTDVFAVAAKVSEMFATLHLGGNPFYYRLNYDKNDGNLRVKPYGSKVWWGIDAALTERSVEYSERGHVATVTLRWVSPEWQWVVSREDNDPSGKLIGQEAKQPW